LPFHEAADLASPVPVPKSTALPTRGHRHSVAADVDNGSPIDPDDITDIGDDGEDFAAAVLKDVKVPSPSPARTPVSSTT
jgi:hypothetical protein